MDTNLLQQLLGELMLSKQAALVASNNNVLIATIIASAFGPLLVAAAGYFKAAAAAKHSLEATRAAEQATRAAELAKTASEKSEQVVANTAAVVDVIHTNGNSERATTLKLVEDLRKELLTSKEEAATLRERAAK